MQKYPRHCVTRPDIFKVPWIVIHPDSVLKLGSVFYIVPYHTIHHLLKQQQTQIKNHSGLPDGRELDEHEPKQRCEKKTAGSEMGGGDWPWSGRTALSYYRRQGKEEANKCWWSLDDDDSWGEESESKTKLLKLKPCLRKSRSCGGMWMRGTDIRVRFTLPREEDDGNLRPG
ncbi:hypothetical protein LINPERHAP2_LOCUS24536 [Linum perenne]